MKRIKTAFSAIVFAIALSSTFQCAGQKATTIRTFELQTPFKAKPVVYQEWYAGIKVGGTGINVFIPVTEVKDGVTFNEVYFRNMKGELVENEGKLTAILKNPSPYYTFKKAEKPKDYPFDLKDNECVVSYTHNGKIKYHKIIRLNEVAGTYYEDGPPSTYDRPKDGMASIDEEEEKDN